METTYTGFYARFDTPSKKDAAVLLGADNLVGDLFDVEFVTEEGTAVAWIVNRFGHRVAFLDAIDSLGTLDDGQSDVDGVAIEDAREALGDDTGDASRLNATRRVLSRRPAAKVLASHDDVTRLYPLRERRIEILHAMQCELVHIG